ncbi:MAG: hypothetical protein OQK78_04370, partial [Gammaproteobacteria bacterium]|nr:hypothetical protein [Gammaproteobacteria bacterium]
HRYDSDLGLYIYLESPNTYYHSNYYYRWSARYNYWERSHDPKGSWRRVNEGVVPPKLIKRRLKNRTYRTTPAHHAPAYGYYKSHPHLHRWDNDLGLHIFIESPDTYYNNDHYIRWSVRLNRWERADEPRGGWRQIHEREVPPKLLKKRLKARSHQLNKKERKIDRKIRQYEVEKEIKKERRSERREIIKDRKELKKEHKSDRRDDFVECDDDKRRGRSGKCRD